MWNKHISGCESVFNESMPSPQPSLTQPLRKESQSYLSEASVYLEILSLDQLPKSLYRTIIKEASSHLIKALTEIAYNTLHKNVPLTPAQLKYVTKRKKFLLQLAQKSQSLKKKKSYILSHPICYQLIPWLCWLTTDQWRQQPKK